VVKDKTLKGAASTPVKELLSLIIFKLAIENKDYSEEAVLKIIDSSPKMKIQGTYSRSYYNSIAPSVKYLNKIGLNGSYIIQRPSKEWGNNYVNAIYDHAANLMKSSGVKVWKDDNWNPGDIWLFNNDGIKEVKRLLEIDNIMEFNQALNGAVKMKMIIPLSLKAPDGGPTKLTIRIPDIVTTAKRYDPKDYKLERITLAVSYPTHISTLTVFAKGNWQIYIQAQTPSGKKGPWANKSTGELNKNYVPSLNPTIAVRNASANHGGGSATTQSDWFNAMAAINKGKYTVYRQSQIPGLTVAPPNNVSEMEFNDAVKVLKKYTKPDKGFDGMVYDKVIPQFRIQTVMWASWVKFIAENYEEVFKNTYLMAKKEGGYGGKGGLSKKSFTTHYIIEDEMSIDSWLQEVEINDLYS
jgi:hypothetical protein